MEKIQRFGVPRRLFRRSDVRYSPRRDRSNRLTVLSRLMDSAFVITRDWAEATTAALIACLPIMVQGECELLTIIELYLARGRGHYKETRFVNRGPSRFHPANFLYLESRFHPGFPQIRFGWEEGEERSIILHLCAQPRPSSFLNPIFAVLIIFRAKILFTFDRLFAFKCVRAS